MIAVPVIIVYALAIIGVGTVGKHVGRGIHAVNWALTPKVKKS